jgi:hypothetical protein
LNKRHDITVKIRVVKAGLPRPTKAKSVGLAITVGGSNDGGELAIVRLHISLMNNGI